MAMKYLEKILTARVYDVAEETPLDLAPNLSQRLGNRVWLKREDQQSIFSFKLRGAYNKMVKLPRAALQRGVIAASAGNHAQGVALAAERLNTRAVIVMPVTTPTIKIQAVKQRGAEVVLYGDDYDAAHERARTLARKRKLVLIHPYDDPDVIAGQGTIGMEILRQHPDDLHSIFVPVGGGGLIAGIAAYVKQLRRSVRIIGVEPEDAAAMYHSLRAGRRKRLREVGPFADGVAVRQVGKETFRIARRCVDEVVCVHTDAICAAIKDVFEDTRTIMEPAGALAVAGLKAYVEREHLRKAQMIAITSGANINFDRLRHVAERAEIGERREAILAVTIPERPGSFRKFCRVVGNHSITEFNYRYSDATEAHVFVGIQVQRATEIDALIKRLTRHRYPSVDLTDNEMAKLHVRHLVGGHAPDAQNESVYRFEFPERPGALLEFLEKMGETWNITLFHYRNHGADYARVLCGMQVPPKDKKAFRQLLRNLGYRYQEESGNPAYQLFLG
ncbi:MAG: threonine ammonia-lyase, biosynthetic [Gammaproteobacteria bacterium]|nr:threonine ammonia-lyase, biosynthetic [Gammaproteobacteria bacterium]